MHGPEDGLETENCVKTWYFFKKWTLPLSSLWLINPHVTKNIEVLCELQGGILVSGMIFVIISILYHSKF